MCDWAPNRPRSRPSRVRSSGAARPRAQNRERADARNDRPVTGGHRLERQPKVKFRGFHDGRSTRKTPSERRGRPTGVPATEQPVDLADANGCRVTAPTTTEHPSDANTASFSRAWFVSVDRKLWASATGRLYAGENKVLWERPGPAVSLSGRLWGDTNGLAPTITPSGGYDKESYQASGVTFPAPGCWEVVARAATSELRFVVFVYPKTYSGAGRPCQDLADIYSQSDAVVLATSASERPDTTYAGFSWYTLNVSRSWKGPISVGGTFDLLSDADAGRGSRPPRATSYSSRVTPEGRGGSSVPSDRWPSTTRVASSCVRPITSGAARSSPTRTSRLSTRGSPISRSDQIRDSHRTRGATAKLSCTNTMNAMLQYVLTTLRGAPMA